MTTDSILYLSQAIKKIEAGGAASEYGSHVLGIYGRASNAFEKEIRSYVATLLATCELNYDVDIRAAVSGPPFQKLTLGQCIAVIEQASRLKRARVAASVPGGWKLTGFLEALRKINEAWVQAKHGDDIAVPLQVTRMKSMIAILKLLSSRS